MTKISKEDLATIAAIIGAIASILSTIKALISVDPLFGWIALASVVAGLFWYLVQGRRSVWIIGLLAVLALVSLGAAWWVVPVTVEIVTYIDENRNGMCETFERKGPAGIEVQLLDSQGVMRVAYTDSRGVATFRGVPQGSYGILKVGPGIGGIASRVSRTAPVAILPTPQPPTDTPTPTPTETLTLTPTPTATSTNTPIPTPTPPPNAIVVVNVNLRSGPGTEYDIISTLSPGQILTVMGRITDTTWLQVNANQMQKGWVINQADLVTLNLPPEQIPIVPPPPTPTPAPLPPQPVPGPTTPPPLPPPTEDIRVWADSENISAGSCTTVHWHVSNVNAYWVDAQPETGDDGSKQVCPCSSQTYHLRAIRRDGSEVNLSVTVNVSGQCTPTVPAHTPTPPPTCLITQPVDGDDNLGFKNDVKVTCSDVPDSLYIWILVYSYFDSNFYPKPGPIGSGSGNYEGTAYLGTEGTGEGKGIGDKYGIIVALANEAMSLELRQAAARFSGYALKLPDGVEEMARITVKRGH